jgi:protein ImuB
MSTTPQALWAGLYCETLPLTAAWQLAPVTGPLAVHETMRGQARIIQACRQARAGGIHPGQSLASALAILPQLQTRARQPRAETLALEQIALTAYGHSHQVVLAPPDTVLLEVGGSRRLRGGIEPLLELLCRQLKQQGLSVCCGLAPWPAAARLLARTGARFDRLEPLHRHLASLELSSLELPSAQHRMLGGCGLKIVADLMGLPAAERARRFGKALNLYLDQIHGRLRTPLASWQPAEAFSLQLELPVATAATQALMFVFNRALDSLGSWLEVRDQALTRLQVTLMCENHDVPVRFDLALARPGFDRERLLELINLKLDPLPLPAAVVSIAVKADTTSEHRPAQADLLSGHNRSDAWPALLDRLCARTGRNGIASLAPRPDHRPEQSWSWVPPGTTLPCQETRPRPAWLLPHPRPCDHRQLSLEEGPERIEAGWWDGHDCRRDYWIARDRDQRRLWVFQEYKPRAGWFIHGLFD